jgi:hypothetical protein
VADSGDSPERRMCGPLRAAPGPISGASQPPAAPIRRGAADGSTASFAFLLDRMLKMALDKMRRIPNLLAPVFWKQGELCFTGCCHFRVQQ